MPTAMGRDHCQRFDPTPRSDAANATTIARFATSSISSRPFPITNGEPMITANRVIRPGAPRPSRTPSRFAAPASTNCQNRPWSSATFHDDPRTRRKIAVMVCTRGG